MHPFRAFISYAHEDKLIAEKLELVLREVGLSPIWDSNIKPGLPFSDVIKVQIATSHLFIPLITANSQNRPWVHQETGYALGNDIPILPIVLEDVGVEMKDALQAMLGPLQSIEVKADLSNLIDVLGEAEIERLILSPGTESESQRLLISNQVANYSEDRTRLLVQYANTVVNEGYVRQRGLFSTFSFPYKNPNDIVWDALESKSNKRSNYFRDLIRSERKILEHHARRNGCSLIISPYIEHSSEWALVHCTQLGELLVFLKSMPEDLLSVAVLKEEGVDGNLTLIGDQIGAKVTSITQAGYRNTLFSRHAPTVFRWLQEFENQFNRVLAHNGISRLQSRDYAISRIEFLLRDY